jgi:uncharacterized protein (DUF2236 family)
MIHRTSGEALGLLGAGRAILLQLAHPLVAAGVADHSDFQSDPLARLWRTMAVMHALIFGSPVEVQAAVQRFHRVHARVRGQLPRKVGVFAAGARYSGEDPDLKLWVHATLVDTSLITYQCFVRPLSAHEALRYYADTRRLAQRLHVPDRILPPTLSEFRVYMASMLTGDRLEVTDTARSLAWDLLHPAGVGLPALASARLLRFVTAGLLPQPVREAYGLDWGWGRQMALEALARTTRVLRPWAPAWVWQGPLHGDGLARRLLGSAAVSLDLGGDARPAGP